MSDDRQWLELGLDTLPPAQAARVRLFRVMSAAAAQMRSRMEREMAASGITLQQAALLQFIQAQPVPPTIGTVAASLSMTHQNVKQIALVLERKGFLTITVDAHDRRARRLATTARHRRFWARRNPGDFDLVQTWTAGLNDDEVAQAVQLLRKLVATMPPAGGTVDTTLPEQTRATVPERPRTTVPERPRATVPVRPRATARLPDDTTPR
jgi:DNA-binding MarR family transcriptional regulator